MQAKVSMLVRAAGESAFDAFVDPGTLTRFWLAEASAPLAPGATVRWDFMVPESHETVTVTAFERPHRLAFDWSDGVDVDIRFESREMNAVVVSIVATGFDDSEQAVAATEGFSIVLCDLKTLLESGHSANLVRDKAELIACLSAE